MYSFVMDYILMVIQGMIFCYMDWKNVYYRINLFIKGFLLVLLQLLVYLY